MQLEPCERPSRDAARPHQADAPARYSSGAAACFQGRPHRRALPPPTSACLHKRLTELSRAARPEGSLPPCGCGVRSQPLSGRLPGGVRLLPHPLPAPASVGLAASLPRRDEDGFTTFRRCPVRRLGRASPPGERRPRAASSECRSLSPCLLAQACQPLWPVITNGVYRRFTCVDRFSSILVPDRRAPEQPVAASAHACAAIPRDGVTLSRGLRTPPLPTTHAPVGYCWRNSR